MSIIAIVLSPLSMLILELLIPWEPLMDIHTYFGDVSMFSALIGTILGILALIKKER